MNWLFLIIELIIITLNILVLRKCYISNGGKFGKLEYGNIVVLTVLILWVIWVNINNLI